MSTRGMRSRDSSKSQLNTSAGEDAALDSIARRAEEMLQEKRKERERARRIRLQELQRKQQEEEQALDRQYDRDKADARLAVGASGYPRTGSTSSARNPSTERSRRNSVESNDSSDAANKDLKDKYQEMEEKYRRSMMTNAQLDNEKQALMYTVEDYKDKLYEMEESKHCITRELKDKQRHLDQEKRVVKTKLLELERLQEMVSQRDSLLREHKLIYCEAEVEPPRHNGHIDEEDGASGVGSGLYIEPVETVRAALISEDLMEILNSYVMGTIEEKIKSVLNENGKLKRDLSACKEELEEEREAASKRPQRKSSENQMNGILDMNAPQIVELQRESGRQISEYKLKVQKAELDIAALESSVTRLESQVKRYKEMAEESEKAEDDLKSEKRKMQRELREAQQSIDELATQKSHLQNRLERIRQARQEVLGLAAET